MCGFARTGCRQQSCAYHGRCASRMIMTLQDSCRALRDANAEQGTLHGKAADRASPERKHCSAIVSESSQFNVIDCAARPHIWSVRVATCHRAAASRTADWAA